jgi:hypothetical protein
MSLSFVVETIILRLRSSLRVRLRFSVGLLAEVALEEVKGVIL